MAVQHQAGTFLNPPQVIEVDNPLYQPPSSRQFAGIPSLAISPGGRLWSTRYAGPTPGEDKNNYVVLSTSGDDGRTWTERFIVDPDGDGPIRAFDPEIWTDPLGRVWLFWAQHVASDRLNPHAGVWAMVNEDADRADAPWSAPRRLTEGIMMCKPTVLSSGRWLLPASTWRATDYSARAVASDDHGQSFEVLGGCQVPPEDRAFDEHMIVERQDGSLWMLVRTKYGIGESISTDGGRTWSLCAPSEIAHTSSRFFIRRLQSGNLLLVKHGPIDTQTGRSHLTAFLSEDDGQSWIGGLLLDERSGVSYPDGQQVDSGLIYITYDYSRTGHKAILMSTFTEADVRAGEAITDGCRFRVRINPDTKLELADNQDGQPLKTGNPGTFSVDNEGTLREFAEGARIFTDRNYTVAGCPDALKSATFLPIPIDGEKIITCTQSGMIAFLTPRPQRNKDSQSENLLQQGFEKVALPEFSLFNPDSMSNYCTLYQKECAAGEKIELGKWAVPVICP